MNMSYRDLELIRYVEEEKKKVRTKPMLRFQPWDIMLSAFTPSLCPSCTYKIHDREQTMWYAISNCK